MHGFDKIAIIFALFALTFVAFNVTYKAGVQAERDRGDQLVESSENLLAAIKAYQEEVQNIMDASAMLKDDLSNLKEVQEKYGWPLKPKSEQPAEKSDGRM